MTRSGPATGRATVCLALLLVVSLSGCAGLTGFAESQPALPGPDEATDRAASLDTMSATVRTVQHTDEGTVTTVSAVKRRLDPPGYRSRVRSVTSNTSGRVYATEGHLTISNRTTTVLYRPDEERVSYIVDPDREWESPYVDMLAAARENETIRRPTPGVPSLVRQRDDGGVVGPVAGAVEFVPLGHGRVGNGHRDVVGECVPRGVRPDPRLLDARREAVTVEPEGPGRELRIERHVPVGGVVLVPVAVGDELDVTLEGVEVLDVEPQRLVFERRVRRDRIDLQSVRPTVVHPLGPVVPDPHQLVAVRRRPVASGVVVTLWSARERRDSGRCTAT
jgi:hypothetical protein